MGPMSLVDRGHPAGECAGHGPPSSAHAHRRQCDKASRALIGPGAVVLGEHAPRESFRQRAQSGRGDGVAMPAGARSRSQPRHRSPCRDGSLRMERSRWPVRRPGCPGGEAVTALRASLREVSQKITALNGRIDTLATAPVNLYHENQALRAALDHRTRLALLAGKEGR